MSKIIDARLTIFDGTDELWRALRAWNRDELKYMENFRP